jgi:hypothetical protein
LSSVLHLHGQFAHTHTHPHTPTHTHTARLPLTNPEGSGVYLDSRLGTPSILVRDASALWTPWQTSEVGMFLVRLCCLLEHFGLTPISVLVFCVPWAKFGFLGCHRICWQSRCNCGTRSGLHPPSQTWPKAPCKFSSDPEVNAICSRTKHSIRGTSSLQRVQLIESRMAGIYRRLLPSIRR